MVFRIPNVESLVAIFWQVIVARGEIRRRVRVWHTNEGTSDELTHVAVHHELSPPPFRRRGHFRWLVTTDYNVLPRPHFGETAARRTVSDDGLKPRGRALYCVDLRAGEVVAALSFHVDKRKSLGLKIRAIVFRLDGDDRTRAISRACGRWLLGYAHEIARQDNRAPELFAEVDVGPAEDVFLSLGFRRATPPRGYAPKGRVYLELRPPRLRLPRGQR